MRKQKRIEQLERENQKLRWELIANAEAFRKIRAWATYSEGAATVTLTRIGDER